MFRFSLLASRFSLLAFASFVFLFSFLISAQVIIKEKVEINPQTINPDYQVSSLDPCPSITRPQYYQSVYSCSGFPIEPYQQLYPFQSGTFLVFEPTTLYEVEIITGTEYAYFERVEHIDTLGNFYPYETFGTLLNGLTGAELSGTGNYIGYEGLGTFERENSSVYRIHFDNYSQAQATVTMRIKYLNTDVFTDWHTLIVNPDLRFVNQQNEADTLLHYYSKDVTPKFINANSPCAHPGYGGCPPDNVTFNIEVIEGQQYGSIKNFETNEIATSFTGLSYNNLNTTFTYYANGVQPDSTATVRIRHSSNDPEIIPQEFSFTIKKNNIPPPSEGGSIYVKMDKQIVIPGDTVNVQLRWIDAVGDTVEFSQIQRFKVDLAEGSEYGTILDVETGDTSDTFTEIANEFKVIVAPQIEPETAKIVLVAEADLIIFTRPVGINNGTDITKQLQEHTVDKVDDEGGTNTDVIIIGNHLVGVGEITITKTPFVVEIIPSVISAGDTAQIFPMKLNADGTTTPFDSLQTFELGMLDGCALGYLSAETDSNNYFYEVKQPFYFIADTIADSGSVNIRVGVIEMNQQNRSLTNNNSNIENDNPVSCANVSFEENLYANANVVVGNKCEDYPCDENFKYTPPDIVSEIDDIVWSTTYTYENATRDFCPEGSPKGGHTRILFDDAFDVPFNSRKLIKDQLITPYTINACFDIQKNKWQYSILTNGVSNKIKLRVLVSMCDWGEPTDINDIAGLNNIPEEDVCLALEDFEKHRPYPFIGMGIPFPKKYHIKNATINHEKVHVMFFQQDITKTLKRKHKYYGVVKSFKDHLRFSPDCTEIFNNKISAIYQGKKYYEGLMKEFVKQLHSIYSNRTKDSFTNENRTQWNDYVQNTITYYQKKLKEKWPLVDCDYDMSEEWKIYEQYINKF